MTGIEQAEAVRSLLAPVYGWWRRRFGKADLRLELRKGMPFEITEPGGAKGHAVRGFRVRVRNAGTHDYECLAKLEEMTRPDGTPFENAYLPVGLKTQHQKEQKRPGGVFNLRSGESQLIEVAYLDERDANSEIVLQYETDDPNCVPRTAYSLTVRVYGGGKPAEGHYRLYVDGRGFLKMVES
ncbi:MAG: hypothetical protein H0U97_03580 [Gammaproteobacteria bacterium]|nr:hypothetical protein [Gammaproteobacteria bacterium]